LGQQFRADQFPIFYHQTSICLVMKKELGHPRNNRRVNNSGH